MPSSPYQRLVEDDDASSITKASTPNDSELTLTATRPETYYGEGPFSPPSSDDEDDDENGSFLDKHAARGPASPGLAELGERHASGSDDLDDEDNTILKKRSTPTRLFAILLSAVLLLSFVIGLFAARNYQFTVQRFPGQKKLTMDSVFDGTFGVQSRSVNWIEAAGDGVFSVSDIGKINLVDLKSNTTRTLVDTLDVKDEMGFPLNWFSWDVSPDLKYILFKADYRKQWRWSTFGNYYIHNIEEKKTQPLIPPSHPPRTAYAAWSPIGHSIAYVIDNDLYVLPSPSASPIRVTSSGTASLFHGVPDWVYEEEIFSADFALWWSPDAKKISYLVFDETTVEEYKFPIYNPTINSESVFPYTSDVVMKYPKPGYDNPLVYAFVFDMAQHLQDTGPENLVPVEENTHELEWPGRFNEKDSIIMEVKWVGNASLIIKEVNRNADNGNVVLFNLDDANERARPRGRVVRKLGKNGEQGDKGWIDSDQNIRMLPASLAAGSSQAYLDIVPSADGYNHIALFSPADSSTPQFLTSGKWEVVNGIQGVDVKKGVVYFQAANPSSIERHIFSVPLPKAIPFKPTEPTPLTNVKKQAYYSAKFSPHAGFYSLSYLGPAVPWQKVLQTDNSTFEYILTTNDKLQNATMVYEAPTISRFTIMSDGYELNVQEIRPPRMDDSGRVKYPVLFRVYGGPASQLVDLQFARNWHDYLACGLSYIVVVVDGRGTGFKGRHLRNPVKDNLGFFETIDQINAAKIWASKPYVDRKRIGIWGWSYGGFMSSKVVEANAGVHSLAIAVAPVTSWRLYDSIYTERYMNLPQLNPGGYVNASISNVTGFHNVDYLLAHGSGDDNVHFANSAHLLDMLTAAQVRNFRFRTDWLFHNRHYSVCSDHSISTRGAQRELYEFMTGFLLEKWGKGGRRRGY